MNQRKRSRFELQRIAVIDLGSNTARLVVMSCLPGRSYRVEDEIREVVRLREGMTPEGLSDSAMLRGFSALKFFKRFCDSTHIDSVVATATSAVRDAANGAHFVTRVRREIGLPLRVLDGETEARYGAIGALNEFEMSEGTVMDLGGGSMQVSEIADRRFCCGVSLPLGALALTERFVSSDPISRSEYKSLKDEVDRQVGGVHWLADRPGGLVGIGGTIRNLARIEAVRRGYPLSSLHAFSLTRSSIEQSIAEFRELPLGKRREIPGLSSDRADIILAGATVVLSVMARVGVDELLVSVNGLREGLFFERFWQHLSYPVIADVRRFGVLNTARTYGYSETHARQVRHLARSLFDQLRPLHGYSSAERALLDAAAMLHDLGTIISYKEHDLYSHNLVLARGLPGFTPRELALVALLTRYHRKGKPDISAYRTLMGDDDELRLQRLAALLRMAEYLERGRTGIVEDVAVTITAHELRVVLIVEEYPAVEIWQTQLKAVPLMESVYKRRLILESAVAPPEWDAGQPPVA